MHQNNPKPGPHSHWPEQWHPDPNINRILQVTVEKDWSKSGFRFRAPGSQDRYLVLRFEFKCGVKKQAALAE